MYLLEESHQSTELQTLGPEAAHEMNSSACGPNPRAATARREVQFRDGICEPEPRSYSVTRECLYQTKQSLFVSLKKSRTLYEDFVKTQKPRRTYQSTLFLLKHLERTAPAVRELLGLDFTARIAKRLSRRLVQRYAQ